MTKLELIDGMLTYTATDGVFWQIEPVIVGGHIHYLATSPTTGHSHRRAEAISLEALVTGIETCIGL